MTEFLLGLLQIIIVNLVLSGDNAVVIALACRNLSPNLQKKAVFWGSFGVIGLRVILTFIAIWLLKIPFVQVVGAFLEELLPALHIILPVALALVVIAVGNHLKRKAEKEKANRLGQGHAETV